MKRVGVDLNSDTKEGWSCRNINCDEFGRVYYPRAKARKINVGLTGIDEDIYYEIKAIAVRNGVKVNELVNEAFLDLTKKYNMKGGNDD